MRVSCRLGAYFVNFNNYESGGSKCWNGWGSGFGYMTLKQREEFLKGKAYIFKYANSNQLITTVYKENINKKSV